MPKMIFVNLPVTDLDASMTFYKSLGFENNAHFTDDTTACMVWSEAINVMLHTHAKWRKFTKRPLPPVTSSEVMLTLSCDSREAVDAMNKARRKRRDSRHQSHAGSWFHVQPQPDGSQRPYLGGGVDEPGGRSLGRSNTLRKSSR